MIHKATREDIPRLFEIRDAVGENRLGDPSRVTVALCAWFIGHSAFWLWVEDGPRPGLCGGRSKGWADLRAVCRSGLRGRGIGSTLLPLACESLQAAGHQAATLTTEPRTRAERFYRRDGWIEIGREQDGQIVFRKELRGHGRRDMPRTLP